MSSNHRREATYQEAGVDIAAADRLVSRFGALARTTKIPGVLGDIGGFGALFSLRDALDTPMTDPVLVSGTDGVGTKLKVAFAASRHDSIGIDLVAMCVNDILTTGAKPLFFLDYFGTSVMDSSVVEAVVSGISEGCRRAQCALIGGETAELPGMYAPGEYDLAGFAVGVVDRQSIIDGTGICPGHAVVGISSHGLHSNGYSLAREVLLNRAQCGLDQPMDEHSAETWADVLLHPTAIYTQVVSALVRSVRPLAMAHITGGGLPGNLSRVLPTGTSAELWSSAWTVPAIFHHIQRLGPVSRMEMYRTFNMGVGLVVVTDQPEKTVQVVEQMGETAQIIGTIRAIASDTDEAVVIK
ncbi:MAG: phosphoribosylformylglycinamidine cyclo-ligase [Myxococcales bacterium]|nr:phosphoribosylformylglycinamidine cyclo-ligase [Myxococcales bacterium]